MEPSRWRRVVDLFSAALEREPAARAELLGAPDVDPELRMEVESMLTAHFTLGTLDRLEPEMERLRSEALAGADSTGGDGFGSRREPALEPGRKIGRYEIRSPLGAGGMGAVYRAFDPRLQREVAIKVVARGSGQGPRDLERLEQEARAASALNHPNICTIYDIGEEGAAPYIVMELIDGSSLREVLSRPLDSLTVVSLGRQIASGLAAAHERGIVHRDLKPENILVSRAGNAKILDFGLARFRLDGLLGEDLGPVRDGPTTRSALRGTPGYMSPELIRGGPVDPRSDQFSLGAILHEMASGKRAFAGPTALDSLDLTLESDPPSLRALRPDLPPAFVSAVERCLAKSSEQRYASTGELLGELAAIAIEGSPAPAAARRPGRRLPWIAALLALPVMAGLAAWGARREAISAVPRRLVPLTHGEGDDSHPTFFPDGRRIVFTSDRDGQQDLWVADVSGAPPVRLTDTPEAEDQPALSPDGSQVAFVRMRADRNADLYLMPLQGGEPRRLAEGAMDPAWSPDGGSLAYSEFVKGWTRIARLTLAGGASPVAVTALEEGRFQRNPSWARDGRSIVFNSSPGGYIGGIMRVPSAGGRPEPLTLDSSGTANLSAVVTPDGRYVVHVSDRGGALNLWRVPLAGGAPERITSGPGRDLDPCISPDGTRIAFVSSPEVFRVLEVSVETGQTASLARFEGSDVWGPDVSPDGSQIVFAQKVSGLPWRMMRMPTGGGAPRTILDGLSDVLWVRFLPGGASVVFEARGPHGGRIGTVGTDGSGLAWRTPEDEDARYPDVSPSAALLAYVRNETSHAEVVVRPLAGGPPVRVVPGATLPRFSPDGRSIAVAGSKAYALGVGVVELAGGERRWLSPTGSFPAWLPDGRTLAFADAGPDGSQTAWAVSVLGGAPRRLSDFRWHGKFWPFVSSRDGKHLITTDGSDIKSTIWLAEF